MAKINQHCALLAPVQWTSHANVDKLKPQLVARSNAEAPTTKAFMIAAGSFQPTRTTGAASVAETACSTHIKLLKFVTPCYIFIHTASKPCLAMISAVKVLAMEIHPKLTGLPCAHSCLILLGFILIIFVTFAESA